MTRRFQRRDGGPHVEHDLVRLFLTLLVELSNFERRTRNLCLDAPAREERDVELPLYT